MEKSIKCMTQKLISSALLSLFWVLFTWNFWERGIYALGINSFIFLIFLFSLFILTLYKSRRYVKEDLVWIIPIFLIILSYSIYDNPFLKVTNFLVLPISFVIFYNYAFLDNKKTAHWDFSFILTIIKRAFSFLALIGKTVMSYIELLIPAKKGARGIISKVIAGIILFLVIALTVFIPLLSSADPVFATKMKVIYDFINNFISTTAFLKILVFLILSIIISSTLFAWSKKFSYSEKGDSKEKLEPIVSGIVLGGVLVIYLLFLWVQIERLWVGVLPFDFKETESLVKSGFWQLFFLTLINIIIYLFTYRKTNKIVSYILIGFSSASLLLLSSAGYRMVLYLTNYGLSYEKFFASYTVLYCAILFIFLISRLFIKNRANIIKFLVVLFIWMYALITIFPVESFIFKSNINLSNREDSRIRLYEMTMLSPDVLSIVKDYNKKGLLKERENVLTRDGGKLGAQPDWSRWIKRNEKIVNNKKWYEKNLLNILN